MRLYKYLAPERTSILRDGLIRFSQPQAFNDPFELKPHLATIADRARLEESLEANLQQLIKEEYAKQPAHIRAKVPFAIYQQLAISKREEILRDMEAMAKYATPQLEKVIHESFEKHVGILSLTENPHNILMWAHYANSHQGYVIEFDSNHRFFDQRKSENDELRHLRKVAYSSTRPSLSLHQLNGFSDFLVKSTEWSYEQEWRIIHALAESDKKIEAKPHNIYLFRVPFEAIRSVIIGSRATSATSTEIEAEVASNPELRHVSLYRMEIHEMRFELVMRQVTLTNTFS